MTNKLTISSGHSLRVRGAKNIIDEVNEARRVVDRVTAILQAGGVGVIKYHDDTATSQAQNLKNITSYHNKQQRDLDVSVHFNAASYTPAARGCEVLHFDTKTKAAAASVSAAMAKAGGFKDRGAKQRTNLAFLRDTNRPALLIEVCFVDSEKDVQQYKANFEAICQAIAKAVAAAAGATLKAEQPKAPAAAQKPAAALYRVITGTYPTAAQAMAAEVKIKALKIAWVTSIEQVGDQFRVVTGTYTTEAAARVAVQKIKDNRIAWVCDYKAA